MRSAKPPAQLRHPPPDAEIDDGLVSWISHMPAGSSREKLHHFLACAKQGAILLVHCGLWICNDSSAGRGGADSRVRRVYEPVTAPCASSPDPAPSRRPSVRRARAMRPSPSP